MTDICCALLEDLSGRLKKYPAYRPLSGYNIFQVLGVEAKEVIMCRFLASLLNPEGAHQQGILFLKTFLRDVLDNFPMSDTLLTHTDVVTEYGIDNDRRIDIVIQNSQYFIPIEVKLYAGEQEGQCYAYYQYARNAPLVYLTRFGEAPSGYSLKQKGGSAFLPLDWDHIRCISWSRTILQWLSGLLPQLSGPVKPMVEQYMDTIHSIADERRHRLMEQSVQAALTSPEFFQAGLELERSMKKAKLTLMRLMFDCFKKEMEPLMERYDLAVEREAHFHSYEMPPHDGFYDSTRSTFPGLNYVVKHAKFQNENLQMWFRLEITENLFAGFTLFDMAAEPQTGYPKGYQVDNITPALIEEAAQYLDRDMISPYWWWLTWCYPNGKHQDSHYDDVPDFRNMNQCAVDLVDPQKRREYIRQAVRVFERELLQHLL